MIQWDGVYWSVFMLDPDEAIKLQKAFSVLVQDAHEEVAQRVAEGKVSPEDFMRALSPSYSQDVEPSDDQTIY